MHSRRRSDECSDAIGEKEKKSPIENDVLQNLLPYCIGVWNNRLSTKCSCKKLVAFKLPSNWELI